MIHLEGGVLNSLPPLPEGCGILPFEYFSEFQLSPINPTLSRVTECVIGVSFGRQVMVAKGWGDEIDLFSRPASMISIELGQQELGVRVDVGDFSSTVINADKLSDDIFGAWAGLYIKMVKAKLNII